MLGIIVLLEAPVTSCDTSQTELCSLWGFFLMLDWFQPGRFPEETKQPQSITEPPSCFTVARQFFSAFFLQPYHPKSSSSVSSLLGTKSQLLCGLFLCFWAGWGPLLFCFCVSSGVVLQHLICALLCKLKTQLAPLATSDSAVQYLELSTALSVSSYNNVVD